MMTSQSLKFAGFKKIKKSRYLEKETFFFIQIKKLIKRYQAHIKRYFMTTKNSFIAEVTFKLLLILLIKKMKLHYKLMEITSVN